MKVVQVKDSRVRLGAPMYNVYIVKHNFFDANCAALLHSVMNSSYGCAIAVSMREPL